MELDKLLNEMEGEEATQEAPEETSAEEMKILINSDSAFRGRIAKPKVVSFKYKDLASALSDASGLTINRSKAKAMFDAFKSTMGL